MSFKCMEENGVRIAVAEPAGKEKLITDAQSALELAMTVQYETGATRIAIPKGAIADAFFILSSGLAGEILQKYVNYHVKLAVFGDFSRYTSKPLHDFLYESNKGNDVFFVSTEAEAIDRLAKAK